MESKKSISKVSEMLVKTENGGVKNSIENCVVVLEHDPMLCGVICYNCLTERVDSVKPLEWQKTTPSLTDTDMDYLIFYFEKQYGISSEKKIERAISIVANRYPYHPICDYLNSLQWDGTEHIRFALYHFLGADVNEYTEEAIRLLLLGAISRVFRPGCKFEYMICLVGGQGAGKSTFFRLLAVRDEWFSDDWRKIDYDNVYRKLQGHWIMEISEMIVTANTKSIEYIKSFLSRPKETDKVPYETHQADRLRQCVFGRASNTMNFLPLDCTGNRRFLAVEEEARQMELPFAECTITAVNIVL